MWRITPAEVRTVIEQGRTIERYPHDTPYPSRLLLGVRRRTGAARGGRRQRGDDETIVVTVYEPDPALWHRGFGAGDGHEVRGVQAGRDPAR